MSGKTMEERQSIAVSKKEFDEYGCPYCGYRSGYTYVACPESAFRKCAECGRYYVVLFGGRTRSSSGDELQDHPRRGIPSHGNPDKQPVGGGEFFQSRGIGVDRSPGCFVCGGDIGDYSNIAAFVQCKEAGKRIVAMFGEFEIPGEEKLDKSMFTKGVGLDYREHEPDRVQIKIGACPIHKTNLMLLHKLTVQKEGVITREMIAKARSL